MLTFYDLCNDKQNEECHVWFFVGVENNFIQLFLILFLDSKVKISIRTGGYMGTTTAPPLERLRGSATIIESEN